MIEVIEEGGRPPLKKRKSTHQDQLKVKIIKNLSRENSFNQQHIEGCDIANP
jgi:hypothetical protein